jgi:hypothetical protein
MALGQTRWWIGASALAAALLGMGLALLRTVPNAMRLGRAIDSPETMTTLARKILLDHRIAIAAMITVLILQLLA